MCVNILGYLVSSFVELVPIYLFDIKFMFLFLFFVPKRLTMLPLHLGYLSIFLQCYDILAWFMRKILKKKKYM